MQSGLDSAVWLNGRPDWQQTDDWRDKDEGMRRGRERGEGEGNEEKTVSVKRKRIKSNSGKEVPLKLCVEMERKKKGKPIKGNSPTSVYTTISSKSHSHLQLISHIFLRQLKVLVIVCRIGALYETLIHTLLPCGKAIRVATASIVEKMYTTIGYIIITVDLLQLLVLRAETHIGHIHAFGWGRRGSTVYFIYRTRDTYVPLWWCCRTRTISREAAVENI